MAKCQEADPTRPKINSLGGPRVICIDLFCAARKTLPLRKTGGVPLRLSEVGFNARWIAYCYKPAEVAA